MTAITVLPGVAQGEVAAPPSKSVTHRAFLLAAQSDSPCVVTGALLSADTRATLRVLHGLGARFVPEETAVRFDPAPFVVPRHVLDCANSGTTLRLAIGLAARQPFPVALDGDASLRTRPNGPLLDAVRSLGAQTQSRGGCAPVQVAGPAAPGTARLPPRCSSQYASSLLLNLPMLAGPSEVVLEPPVASAPYLELTRAVAHDFGLRIDVDATRDGGMRFSMPGGDRPSAVRYDVEGDWSGAAFPLCAAAVTGGRVTVTGLDAESRQGDRAIVDHLRAFGARVEAVPGGVRVEGPGDGPRSGGPTGPTAGAAADVAADTACGSSAAASAPGPAGPDRPERPTRGGRPASGLKSPGTIDIGATPDLFPALSVVAAVSRGATRFVGGSSLRVKESDRIAAMAGGLAAMGCRVRERPDGLEVEGGALKGSHLHARGDHRVHMAFCVAALAAQGPSRVEDAESAAVSYPAWHDHLQRLTEAPS